MTPDDELVELLVAWHEAAQAGRVLTPEDLAPHNPDLQQRLRQAIAKQHKLQRAFQSTSTLPASIGNDDCPEALPVVQGYQLQRLLGRGGMGSVYEAYDHGLNRTVAIKLLLPEYATNATAKARFLREARSAAAVQSEYVVTIHAVSETAEAPFIVMEYLRGQSLDQWMKSQRATSADVLRIGAEIASGLAAAHAQGLIHRDIKPANIWLEAPSGRVKVLDFGLARSVQGDAELTRSGMIVGTPAYMAPEQARSQKVDHRCDLFSLGSVLYHLATGRRPFTGSDTYSILTSLAMDIPPSPRQVNPQTPEALSNLIDRLLCKNPAERPQTAQEVADLLQRLLRNESISIAPVPLPVPLVEALPPEQGEREVWSGLDASSTEIAPRSPVQKRRSPIWWRTVGMGTLAVCVVVLAAGLFNKIRSSLTPADPESTRPNTPAVVIPPEQSVVTTTGKQYELVAPQLPLKPATIWSLDHLNHETHVPPAERFPWQPKELVGVFGTHQDKLFGNIQYLKRNTDGTKVLAVSDASEHAILLDVASNQQVIVLHPAMGFMPDGKRLFHGNESFPPETPYQNRIKFPVTGPIHEFLRDDLVYGVHDGQWGVWQFENGRAKLTLDGTNLDAVTVAPNRAWLVVQTKDWQIRVYRLGESLQLVREFPQQRNRVPLALANNVLALTSDDKIQLWRLDDKGLTLLQEFMDDVRVDSRLTLNPEGTRLLHMFRLFDISTKPAKVIANDPTNFIHQLHGLQFDDRQQTLIGGYASTLLRLPIRADLIARPPSLLPDTYISEFLSVAVSPDGRWLTTNAASHCQTKGVKQAILDLTTWQPHTLKDDNRGLSALFTPDATRLIVDWPQPNGSVPWGQWAYRMVVKADIATLAKTGEPWLQDPSLRLTAVSPDGTLVAGFRQYGNVVDAVVLRFENNRLVKVASTRTPFTPRYLQPQVRFNNTGQFLLGIGESKSGRSDLVTWAITTTGLHEVQRWPFDSHSGSLLRNTNDDAVVFAGMPLTRYDFKTGKVLKEYLAVGSFDIAPNGQWFVISRTKGTGLHNEMAIVHEPSGKVVYTWLTPGHIQHVRFHPDGRHVLCFNGNGTIYALRVAPVLVP